MVVRGVYFKVPVSLREICMVSRPWLWTRVQDVLPSSRLASPNFCHNAQCAEALSPLLLLTGHSFRQCHFRLRFSIISFVDHLFSVCFRPRTRYSGTGATNAKEASAVWLPRKSSRPTSRRLATPRRRSFRQRLSPGGPSGTVVAFASESFAELAHRGWSKFMSKI